MEDEEYLEALKKELSEITVELDVAREARAKGKLQISQLQTEQKALMAQKHQRERRSQLLSEQAALQRQLEDKLTEKAQVLEALAAAQYDLQELQLSVGLGMLASSSTATPASSPAAAAAASLSTTNSDEEDKKPAAKQSAIASSTRVKADVTEGKGESRKKKPSTSGSVSKKKPAPAASTIAG